MSITLSIIIVNYNSRNMLYDCIASIKEKMLFQDYEIIVVDNNSVDDSVEIVEAKWNDIVVIKNSENLGFSKANNIALRYAKGEYVLFLNNDTVFIEDSISKVFELLPAFGEKFLLGIKLLYQDKSYQVSAFKFPNIFLGITTNFFVDRIFRSVSVFQKHYPALENTLDTTVVDYVLGAFLFGPRNFIDELQGFDERFFFYHEDSDMCKRAYSLDGKVFYVPGTEIIHIGGATSNGLQWFKTLNKYIARIKFYQKHYYGPKFLFLLLTEYLGNIIRVPIFLGCGFILFKKEFILKAIQHLRLLFIYPRNKFVKWFHD